MSAFGKCGGGGRRSAAREAAPLMALLTTLQQACPAIAVNVSRSGCRLRAGVIPAIGDELMISIDRVRTFGTVRWIANDHFGIEFDQPLSLDEIRSLRINVALDRGVRPGLRATMEDWTLSRAR